MSKNKSITSTLSSDESFNLLKARWNSFNLYNGYRIIIALALLFNHGGFQHTSNQNILSLVPLAYLVFSIIGAVLARFEKPKLEIILPAQIIADIVFILLFMYVDSINYTGMGLLLVITIAAASLISDGRLSLFYAAIATIGLLLQQLSNVLFPLNASGHYSTAVTISIACFAIAWMAHSLARRLHQSEQLASQRGLDLKSLAHINALITHRMHDGVIVVNNDLFIKHHNLQANTFLSLEKLDLAQNKLDTIAPEMTVLLKDWFSGSDTQQQGALKISIGSRELQISFLAVAENRDQGAVVFIEDWTQIQSQSQQAKLAALGHLTAKVAHEIRNPLSSVSHANQLLQEDEEMSSPNRRLLQIIQENVSRLDQIVTSILELNRRDRTNQEQIKLNSFMSDFYQQFCAVEGTPTSHVTLTIADEGVDAAILFDSPHLNQIIWNLCKNGWRHSLQSENSVQLNLYTTKALPTVHITVTNNGDGITNDVQQHLFEPFFTTESTGTGLGLYISKELAEANGAKLQYQPTNTGTQFMLKIKKATI